MGSLGVIAFWVSRLQGVIQNNYTRTSESWIEGLPYSATIGIRGRSSSWETHTRSSGS